MKSFMLIFLISIFSLPVHSQKIKHSSLTRDLFYISSKGEVRTNLVGMPKRKIQKRSVRIERKKALKVLKNLISRGANINHNNSLGKTPLMGASEIGYFEAVNLLIKSGAKINQKDKSGNTALIIAAQNNKIDVVKALLKARANRKIKNKAGVTALDVALDKDIQEFLKNYK